MSLDFEFTFERRELRLYKYNTDLVKVTNPASMQPIEVPKLENR